MAAAAGGSSPSLRADDESIRRGDPAITPSRRYRFMTISRFGIVGISGLGVNAFLLWALVQLHVQYLVAAVLATQGSTVWNFSLTDRWVFRDSRNGFWLGALLSFAAVNNGALLLRIPLLAFLTSRLGIQYLISNLITLILLFLVRFLVSDRVIWKQQGEGSMAREMRWDGAVTSPVGVTVGSQQSQQHASPNGQGARTPSAPDRSSSDALALVPFEFDPEPATELRTGRPVQPHRYDINGFVTVASEVQLPELEFFRDSSAASADIEIRVGLVGRRGPRTRLWIEQLPGSVSYQEHLGRLGANFEVAIGDRIEITVGPLLARSPHVLYTNVVEALLRFVLASRDRVLLHAATIALDGRGVMLSAKTDTGKTGTVLRLLRDQSASFLADDMTILDPSATAHCYPKPLTISAHTLRAVNTRALGWQERLGLAVQSRIHSKSGRAVGQRLAEGNLPIMALNAVTQLVVPPPKYPVTRLVPCEIVRRTTVTDLFIIERGRPSLEVLDNSVVLRQLLDNTDDAYGFPPFRYFAPLVSIDGDDYVALRARERAVLASAMRRVRVRRIARDDFSWADAIPELLDGMAGPQEAGGRSPERSPVEWSPSNENRMAGVFPKVDGEEVSMPELSESVQEIAVERERDA